MHESEFTSRVIAIVKAATARQAADMLREVVDNISRPEKLAKPTKLAKLAKPTKLAKLAKPTKLAKLAKLATKMAAKAKRKMAKSIDYTQLMPRLAALVRAKGRIKPHDAAVKLKITRNQITKLAKQASKKRLISIVGASRATFYAPKGEGR